MGGMVFDADTEEVGEDGTTRRSHNGLNSNSDVGPFQPRRRLPDCVRLLCSESQFRDHGSQMEENGPVEFRSPVEYLNKASFHETGLDFLKLGVFLYVLEACLWDAISLEVHHDSATTGEQSLHLFDRTRLEVACSRSHFRPEHRNAQIASIDDLGVYYTLGPTRQVRRGTRFPLHERHASGNGPAYLLVPVIHGFAQMLSFGGEIARRNQKTTVLGDVNRHICSESVERARMAL